MVEPTEQISATGGIDASSTAVAVQARPRSRTSSLENSELFPAGAYWTMIVPVMLGWIEQR